MTKHGSKHVEEDCVSDIESKQDLPSDELIDGVEDDLQQGHDDQLQHGHLEIIFFYHCFENMKEESYTMVFLSFS